MKNYYKILGLNFNASKKDISHAYKMLAMKYHPDVNKEKDAQEKFKEISESYQTLKDPLLKKEYDIKFKNFILNAYKESVEGSQNSGTYGASYTNQNKYQNSYQSAYYNAYTNSYFTSKNDTNNKKHFFNNEIFKKIFKKNSKISAHHNIFSSIRNKLKMRENENKKKRVLTFFNVLLAPIKYVLLLLVIIIRLLFLPFIICYRKHITNKQNLFYFYNVDITPVEAIFGTYKILIFKGKDIKVLLPPHSYNGKVLSFKFKNEKKPVIVYVNVIEDEYIEVNKKGIIINVPVSFKEAVMGGEIKVPTPKGIVNVMLPSSTKSGTLIRIVDSKMVLKNGTVIDIYFRIVIKTPKKFNNDSFRNAINEIDKYFNYNNRDDEIKNVFNYN